MIDLENVKTKAATWWNVNKDKVEVGVKCLGIGLLIGFVKGMLSQAEVMAPFAEGIRELVYPSGEKELEDWWEQITDSDFDIVQRLVHEAE